MTSQRNLRRRDGRLLPVPPWWARPAALAYLVQVRLRGAPDNALETLAGPPPGTGPRHVRPLLEPPAQRVHVGEPVPAGRPPRR